MKEEKSVFDVLIVSAIDIEEMKKGKFFDTKKISANVYVINERDFLFFYKNREKYLEDFKIDDFDHLRLYNAMTIVPIVTTKGLFRGID